MKPAAPPPLCDEANPLAFAPQGRGAPGRPIWLTASGFGFSYFLGSYLSADLTASPGFLVNFWLPSGLFLGMLLLTRPRHWLLLVAAAGVGDIGYNVFFATGAAWPVSTLLLVHLGNSLAALTGAWLVRRFVAERPALASVRELVGLLVFGGVVSLPISATVGAGVFKFLDPTVPFWTVWLSWFTSDLLGVLVLAPAMLVWAGKFRGLVVGRITWRQMEGVLLLASLALAVSLAFLSGRLHNVLTLYVAVPFLVWAIIRFGPRGVTLASLIVALLAGWFAARGHALFAGGALTPHEQNTALQVSLGIFAFFGLLPAVVLDAHRRTEVALRASESRFRLLFERTADALLLLDARSGQYIDCNQAAAAMLGCADKHEMLAMHPSKLSPSHQPDGRASFEKAEDMIATALRQGSHRFEWTHCSARRADFPVEVLLTSLPMDARQLLITTWRDISERKQAERVQAALFRIAGAAQSSLSLPDFCQQIHQIIGELLPARNFFVALHDERTDLLSFPYYVDEHDAAPPVRLLDPASLTGQVIRSGQALLLSPEEQARRVQSGEPVLGELPVDWLGVPLVTGERVIGMLAVQSYTGQVRYTESDKELLQYVSKHVAASIAHTQVEAALRESEERHRVLFEKSKDALMTINAEGPPLFTSGNRQALALFGVADEAEFLRVGPLDLSPEVQPDGRASAAKAREMIAVARREGSHAFEWLHRRVDGAEFPCSILLTAVIISGKLVLQATVRDITAQRKLESQLRQSQKMEVVGQLAGGVAHDFNNILTAMMLNLELLQSTPALPADARPALRELGTMTKRAAKLTEQLLMFARQQTMQTRALELNAALAAVLNLLRRVLGEHVSIVVESGAPDLWIEGDAGMLDAAIMNLCINARDAMPGGGKLTLATSVVVFDAAAAGAQTDARPGRFACLRVSDTGCGIAPENLQHIFEPFFTTKEIGKGTGLGLASVHGIVHQHQGWLSVESAVNRGTTFRLFLPLTEEGATVASATPFPSLRNHGTETILLVEDEEAVRTVGEAMLKRLGYRVLTAVDGDDALRKWPAHAGEVDLLLTDMKMPGGLTGLQLGEKLRGTKPGLKIVLMSGYSAEIIAGRERTLPNVHFLAKPFEAATLAAIVRQCLG